MIDLLASTQVELRKAGYTTRLESMNRSSVVCFEDIVVTGFALVFADPVTLVAEWKDTESALLRRHAPSLRAAGDKAWNVYCVFLSESPAPADLDRQIRWIEEDLNRTRKIAACGISSREDLIRALLPILPLQYQARLRAGDITERLRARIQGIAPKASEVVLNDSVPPAEVVRLLGESS